MQLMGLHFPAPILWLLLAVLWAPAAQAVVLPEQRIDALYHRYDGGGMTIDGPSVLVRKNFKEKLSVSANYYVDKVSAASIDVVTSASPYTEERKQKSLGVDYLAGKAIYSFGWTNSEESDYSADTFSFAASQDFFGDMATLSIGYSQGDDTVRRSGDPAFEEEASRQQFRIGITQVLTRNWLLALSHEFIVDEGFLNNPYRSVRFRAGNGFSFQSEVYPETRASDATAIRSSYYLPWRAGLHAEYRRYSDSWGVQSQDWGLSLVQPWRDQWEFELKLRQYDQTQADFYSDLFPFQNAQNFLARDKELSTFTSTTVGAAVSYTFLKKKYRHLDRLALRVAVDYYNFDYDNFRDIRDTSLNAGEEPLYSFSATVTQVLFSLWY